MLNSMPDSYFYVDVSAWHIKLNTTVKEILIFVTVAQVVIMLMWPRLNAARLNKDGSKLVDLSSSTVL